MRQDERPGLGQGQEEADLGARHRPGRECGQHQEELQQAPPLHHHQGWFLDAIASLQFSMSVRPSVPSLDFDNLMSCHSHF